MATPGEDRDAPRWKFVSSVVIWSVVAAVMGVMLFPTMSSYKNTNPDLLWAGAGVVAIPAVLALVYGFTQNLYVGVGALAGFGIATGIYLASKGGACMALASVLIALRGAWLLFRATRAQRAAAANPSPPPPPAPSPAP